MNGTQYKDTFAAKGSALYEALMENKVDQAKKIYADTSARFHATVHGMAVQRIVIPNPDKPEVWSVESDDAMYDKSGRFVRRKECTK